MRYGELFFVSVRFFLTLIFSLPGFQGLHGGEEDDFLDGVVVGEGVGVGDGCG